MSSISLGNDRLSSSELPLRCYIRAHSKAEPRSTEISSKTNQFHQMNWVDWRCSATHISPSASQVSIFNPPDHRKFCSSLACLWDLIQEVAYKALQKPDCTLSWVLLPPEDLPPATQPTCDPVDSDQQFLRLTIMLWIPTTGANRRSDPAPLCYG